MAALAISEKACSDARGDESLEIFRDTVVPQKGQKHVFEATTSIGKQVTKQFAFFVASYLRIFTSLSCSPLKQFFACFNYSLSNLHRIEALAGRSIHNDP